MQKRTLQFALFFVLLLTGAGGAIAQDAQKTQSTNPFAQTSKEFVQNLGNQVIAIISNKKLSAQAHSDGLRDLLHKSFDLNTMGRFVIGRSWFSASTAEQQEYIRLFEKLVVKTYDDRLTFYAGEGFQTTNARQEGDHDFIVNSLITHTTNQPTTHVDWRVRVQNNNPQVIDVIIEGVSLSVTQRQEYSSIIQKNDGKVSALLDLMRKSLDK